MYETTIYAVGFIVIMLCFIVLCALAIGLAVALLFLWFPKLHWGRPKFEMQLRTYDPRMIMITKQDWLGLKYPNITPTPTISKKTLVQNLTIKKWYGFSSKNKVTWYFGLLRCEENKDD